MKQKKIIVMLIIIYILGILTPFILGWIGKTALEGRVIYEITIEAPSINVRPDIDLSSDVIMQVYKGETFKVVEFYSGNAYDWYRIIYADGKSGWIASGKQNSWVSINGKEC